MSTEDDSKSKESLSEIVAECLAEIEHAQADEDYKTYITEAKEGYKYYKSRNAAGSNVAGILAVMFNPLWSNVEILLPLYFARMPKLVGKRRFEDNNDVGSLACKLLERATDYSAKQESDNFMQTIRACIKDAIITGRGNARVFFKFDSEDAIDEQGKPYKQMIPGSEKATTGYVYFEDYLTNKARNASEHRWRGHRSYMTRRELIARFGSEIGVAVPLNNTSDDKIQKKDYVSKAEVWEKWRESDKMVYWIAPQFSEQPLDSKLDPLKLDGFYPYPRPLMGTTSTDSDIPVGQYKIDKKLLTELNDVCTRVSEISKIIRVIGLHDKSLHSEIIKMRSLQDGQTQPANFPQGKDGVFKSGVDWWPFEKAATALEKLTQYGEWIISKLWQQDGIPDIVRGASDPNETLGAQQIKSNFTVIRTSDKQMDVQRFCKDLLSMKAQIIFEFFSDEMIAQMVGAQHLSPDDKALYPQALELLRSDRMRTFEIDIETDSTIAVDEEADKGAATEAFTAVTQGMNVAFQTMQIDPQAGISIMHAALYVANRFRGARDWTSALEKWIDSKEQELKEAEQNPQPPPPDPEMIKAEADNAIAEAKLEIENQKALAKAQLDEAIAAHKASIEQMKTVNDIDMRQQKLAADTLLKEKELALKATIARMEMMQDAIQMAEKERFATVEKLKSDSAKAPSIPNITIHLPTGKKVVRMAKDPISGDMVGVSEEIQ